VPVLLHAPRGTGSGVRAPEPGPLAHTYSIIARDPQTGQFGVAVQSHYFSVGPVVPWAEAGVGAVATQSLVLVDYGPRALELMRNGMSSRQALDSLLKADPNPDVRQVAIVDRLGRLAVHTGRLCIPYAGHKAGIQYSCQANLMSNPTVWLAMADDYLHSHTKGDFAERLLQALEAGQKAGGDIRGMQSAALLIVKPVSSGKPWMDKIYDLRVEDSPEPLKELRRLVRLRHAYNLEDEGDNLIAAKKSEEAMKAYEEAMKLAPEVTELQFWAAVSMYSNEREAEGRELFRTLFAKEPHWAELIPRLAKVFLFPNDDAKVAEVVALAPKKDAEK
jgi:uncharacterized Ntn-hydrolase superfamily protein